MASYFKSFSNSWQNINRGCGPKGLNLKSLTSIDTKVMRKHVNRPSFQRWFNRYIKKYFNKKIEKNIFLNSSRVLRVYLIHILLFIAGRLRQKLCTFRKKRETWYKYTLSDADQYS